MCIHFVSLTVQEMKSVRLTVQFFQDFTSAKRGLTLYYLVEEGKGNSGCVFVLAVSNDFPCFLMTASRFVWYSHHDMQYHLKWFRLQMQNSKHQQQAT